MLTKTPMLTKTILALVPLLCAGAACAQSVGNVKGNVLVNHGAGFAPITAATPLKIGDTVMARAGGSATLHYGDGCKVDVIPGTVLTLENVSPCSIVNKAEPADDQPVAQNTGGGGDNQQPGVPPGVIAGGAFLAVAAGGLAIGLSNNHNDHNIETPASP